MVANNCDHLDGAIINTVEKDPWRWNSTLDILDPTDLQHFDSTIGNVGQTLF